MGSSQPFKASTDLASHRHTARSLPVLGKKWIALIPGGASPTFPASPKKTSGFVITCSTTTYMVASFPNECWTSTLQSPYFNEVELPHPYSIRSSHHRM